MSEFDVGMDSVIVQDNAITQPTPWYCAFPEPSNLSPSSITCSEVLQWLDQGREAGKDFVLIDLRRDDYDGGTIRGSLNIPAQSFYLSIPTLYEAFSGAALKEVVFYCGSSLHRGTRAASWFNDFITSKGNTTMQSFVLVGGINGWARAGDQYVQRMDNYQEKLWQG